MRRRTSILVVLLWSGLGLPLAAAQIAGRTDLERRLLAYLNERMYNCCESVVLTRQAGDSYEGFVLFTNGQRSNVRVIVRGGKIDYEFLGWSDSKAEPEPAEAQSDVRLRTELRQLQDRVREQQLEIARLRGLDDAAATTPEASEPIAASRESHVYTQPMYRRIEKGLSHAQVADILGDAGSRISSSYFDGGVNEVWVWVNPDDSHICVVFRDGMVLVRAQSGLGPVPAKTDEQRAATRDFDNWLLARQIAGRIVPLDLSFGQWLDQVREVVSKGVGQSRIDIIEEGNRIIVEVSPDDAGGPTRETHLYLTWMSPHELARDAPELSTTERVCIPVGVRIDGKEDNDPVHTWELMATMAGLSGK